MPAAADACSEAGCPNLKPCPLHGVKPWQNRHRVKRGRSGSRRQRMSRAVILRDNGICHVCGEYGANEADHVIPVAEGGPDTFDNLKAIHAYPCHKNKTQAEAQRARAAY